MFPRKARGDAKSRQPGIVVIADDHVAGLDSLVNKPTLV